MYNLKVFIVLLSSLAFGRIIEQAAKQTFGYDINITKPIEPCDITGFDITYPTADSPSEIPNAPYYLYVYTPERSPLTIRLGGGDQVGEWVNMINVTESFDALLSLTESMYAGGNQAGVQGIFTISASANRTDLFCPLTLPNNTDTSFKVVTNNTRPNACEPVTFTITGGTKPYILVWAVQNDREYISSTLGDDQYIWIANAPPNTSLLVWAEDGNKQPSIATPFIQVVNTSTSNTDCPGVQSTSPNISNSSLPTTPTERRKSSHTGAIAGGVVGGTIGLALVLLATADWILRRRRRKDIEEKPGAQVAPDSNMEENALSPDGGTRVVGNVLFGGVQGQSTVQVVKPGLAVLAPPKAGESRSTSSLQPLNPDSQEHSSIVGESSGLASEPTEPETTPAAIPVMPVTLQEIDAGPAPPVYGEWNPGT